MKNSNLLSVKDLSISLGREPIVTEVSFSVNQGEVLGLVGGSGSGKTTIGLAILDLLAPALKQTSGEIRFKENLDYRRGADIGMIFQEPLYAFNPVFTIGYQICEVLALHTRIPQARQEERIHALLDLVGIREPQRVAQSYPHRLSGGMRQRAMIAQAIAAEPALIIADEPTSNLDVTLQAMVMEVFRTLRRELGLSMILITHDLGVVEHLADRVVVLTQGQVVESGTVEDVFQQPQHPFTRSLLEMVK